jgi:hypothetical protein
MKEREVATADKRDGTDGTPRMLKQWLSERGLTLAQWRADPRFKATGRITPPASLPGKPALSTRRRRQALAEALLR